MNKGLCNVKLGGCGQPYKLANPHRHSKDVTSGLCPECSRKQLREKQRRIIKYD